jgi:F-type H+-transporting ATPase subunit a
VSVRILTLTTTLIFGIALFGPRLSLLAQDGHHDDAHVEAVQKQRDEHGEAADGHKDTPGDDHGVSHEEEFNAAAYVLGHIGDSHEWHLWTDKHGHHVSVYLPVILYSKHSGFHVFSSKQIAHGHQHHGFAMGHGTWTHENKKGKTVETKLDGKIVELDEHGAMVEAGLPLDFSVTKNVFMMFLSVVILLVVFLSLARSYKRSGISEPKGLQGFLEPVIEFIEQDVAIPNIGEKHYARFMPYLLTVFFFILLNNLMGLIPFFPFGANVTGNIALTMVLAMITFFITQFSGNKTYWQHIFNMPGVPKPMLIIMIPVEVIGLFTKPFALMVRLFANITAGHIIVLSLVSMIFIFKSAFVAAPAGLMVIFMDCIELLVAFLQAFIFTLLSALFIGMAMPEHHHD